MSPTETEWRILDLLLQADQPQLVAAIVGAIGSPAAAAEALDSLHAAGLVGRRGDLVFLAPGPPDATR